MNMIEKVARALAAKDGGVQYWKKYTRLAKAAIEAMREPTEEMKNAKTELGDSIHWGYHCHICGGLEQGWTTMIDAALKED